MSKFLVIPRLDFNTVYVTFDNSSNEMEYTKYVLKDMNEVTYLLDDPISNKAHTQKYQSIYNTNIYECITEKSVDDNMLFDELSLEVYIKFDVNEDILQEVWVLDFNLEGKVTYYCYNYIEDDGGVEEIPDNLQDIYRSRFDDMYEAINSFVGSQVEQKYIFDLEE